MKASGRQSGSRSTVPTGPPSDEQLLKEFIQGKDSSFELLVRRHIADLHQFVLRFTGDSVAAEDVVQESLLQVHSSASQFDPHRRFKPWLFTIAANKARDYLRRRGRRHEVPFEATLNHEDEAGRRFLDLLSTDDETPDVELSNEESRRLVKRIIEEMPPNLSEVLILAYYQKLPYKDIGDVVGIPLGTVKSRLHAAVVHFGERYRDTVATRKEG